ncbi:MAG TPA: Ldh family oxidoreductase [Xanthobacteraceae bacterium]|jgi:LDH2 family malate/lactate/ureidoglycolate dehydrogenase|nr:Ldh family oxidoreductase [Xanthobacteraceae bacterium]
MTEQSSGPARVRAEEIEAFVARVFVAAGLPPDDAAALAELISLADLRGSDTHGIVRLPLYVRRLRAGGINPRPHIKVLQERPASALIDGDNGMGHLVMRFAAARAIEKAKTAGIAWVGARMGNHAGPAALYAMMTLPHDMIGIYLAVGSNNHLPPWGGCEPLLGTNPIAVAIPAGEEPPIVLDMAPTVAAYGKVRLKAQLGEEMPVGWMIDREGRPLTDPKRAEEGYLLPIGDYKGYGLSLIIGLLAGTLNRAAFGRDIVDMNKNLGAQTNTGQAILAISIDAFSPPAEFKQNVDAAIRAIRGSQRLPGVARIWLPGEQSHTKEIDRRANGVPLPAALRKSLDELARDLNVAPL